LELELALAQDRRRKLENPNRISGGGSQMDNKNLDEGDAHRPPVIFVSDTEPKFPRIHDALNNDKRANNKSRTEKRPNTDAYN
jgi:hypothetical protein